MPSQQLIRRLDSSALKPKGRLMRPSNNLQDLMGGQVEMIGTTGIKHRESSECRRPGNHRNGEIDLAYKTELKEMDTGGLFFFFLAFTADSCCDRRLLCCRFSWSFGVVCFARKSLGILFLRFPFHIHSTHVTTPTVYYSGYPSHCLLA